MSLDCVGPAFHVLTLSAMLLALLLLPPSYHLTATTVRTRGGALRMITTTTLPDGVYKEVLRALELWPIQAQVHSIFMERIETIELTLL